MQIPCLTTLNYHIPVPGARIAARMAHEHTAVEEVFPVSLDSPISFLVERGVESTYELFTAKRLTQAEVCDGISNAMSKLLDAVRDNKHLKRTEPSRKVTTGTRLLRNLTPQFRYFSNPQDALVEFIDFGYAGMAVNHIRDLQQQDRMTVGTVSSFPGSRKVSAVNATSQQFVTSLNELIEQETWEVQTMVFKGIRHIMMELEGKEGRMVSIFPDLEAVFEAMTNKYMAKANEERDRQVKEELGVPTFVNGGQAEDEQDGHGKHDD